jgi:hypothetical protein
VSNCLSPASAFRHHGQSVTADHGLVRYCPITENGKSTSLDVSHILAKVFRNFFIDNSRSDNFSPTLLNQNFLQKISVIIVVYREKTE